MRGARPVPAVLAGLLLVAGPSPALGQMPLAPVSAAGLTVTPAFEGWYENPDGSFTLSFGYFNRNTDEVLEIPVGPDNHLSPGEADRGQPTRFEPRRHWGVFGVRVPADFGDGRVEWTLRVRGETFTIPGSLKTHWEIDALAGEAGSGNTPPVLRLAASGPEGQGPAGVAGGPLAARVGQPLELSVWARDDGRVSNSVASGGREGVPVTLAWFEHRGPGHVTFSEPETEVPAEGGRATTTATFSAPGTYVVRVRATDASGVAGAGHAQCCWTNAFVTVAVTH